MFPFRWGQRFEECPIWCWVDHSSDMPIYGRSWHPWHPNIERCSLPNSSWCLIFIPNIRPYKTQKFMGSNWPRISLKIGYPLKSIWISSLFTKIYPVKWPSLGYIPAVQLRHCAQLCHCWTGAAWCYFDVGNGQAWIKWINDVECYICVLLLV